MLAIEWLKNLKYLDYELITEDDRNNAKTKFSEGENLDKGDKDAAEENDLSKQVDQELIDAKIDSTHQLFKKILEESEEGKKLQLALANFNDIKQAHLDDVIDEEIIKY